MRIWHRPPIIAVFFAIAIGALAGCMNREAPLSPVPPTARFSEAAAPVQLVFIERTYDLEVDRTTYLYQLQSTLDYTAGGAQDLTGILGVFTDVTVELPSCAPTLSDYFPTDGATIDTTAVGFYGITWGVGYDENPDYYYSVTFPGDVPAGTVRGLVTTGGLTYVQDLTGPCEGTFQVAGTVFVDGDGDGLQDLNELGVADVTVQLSGDASQAVKTDADGNYIFIAGAGSYTVSVDSVTTDTSDFNETLFDAWNPTSPTFRNVAVGPDSFANSFGFEPDIDNIIESIDDDTYPTNGKSYRWWRSQLRHAMRCHHDDDDELVYGGHHHDHWYTANELIGFIHDIQALAIPFQYQFTPGQELEQAYRILNNHACSNDHDDDDDHHGDDRATVGLDIDEEENHRDRREPHCDAALVLQRELLATEFNHVTLRGLTTNFPLQYSLISWGEGLLANLPQDSLVLPGDDMPTAITNPLDEGGKVFKKLNGATGGGGTGN